MLSSITPLGERSRRQRWGVTVAAHALAATAAGALFGAALAVAGGLLPGDEAVRAWILALLLLGGALLDAHVGPLRVPSTTRQVDDRWLRRYRGWAYGAGFGAQLGVGVATIVPTAAVYVVLAGCMLAPSAAWGAAIGAVFGLVRGAAPLTTVAVRAPADLVAFHRALARREAAVSRVTVAALVGLALIALAGALA